MFTKKEVAIFVIIGCIFIVLLTGMDRIDSRYSVRAEVAEKEERLVTFEDEAGYLWEYEEEEEEYFSIGEKVKVYFDNNHTLSRYDDEITKVKKK